MSTDSEIECSLRKSSSDDSKARESYKESKFSYRREFLLSFSQLDGCKKLPSGFDSSILSELKDVATGSPSQSYSDSDSGRWDSNLAQHLQQNSEKGVLGRGAFLREPGPITGVSCVKVQDSGRRNGNLTQQSQQNLNYEILGRSGLLSEPGRLAEVLAAPMALSNCHRLLNRSPTPYRPPHFYKMNLHSSKESKELYNSQCPSLERREEERKPRVDVDVPSLTSAEMNKLFLDSFELLTKEHKAIERKQKDVSDDHKENLDPCIATHPEDSRSHKRSVNECKPSKECLVSSLSNDAWCFSSIQDSACTGTLSPAFASMSLEKGIETKSLNHSPVQEHSDVKVDWTDSSMLSSSYLVDKFTEEEEKPADGISKGTEKDESEIAEEQKYTSLFTQRNRVAQKLMASVTHSADDIYELMSADTSKIPPGVYMCEEIKQSIRPEVSKNQLPQHRRIKYCDVENSQSNTADTPRASQLLLALLGKGINAIDLAGPPPKLNISNSTSGSLLRDPTCQPIHGAGSKQELKSSELGVNLKESAAALIKYDRSDLTFPVDGNASPLPANKFIRTNHEIATPFGDVDSKIGLDFQSEQELELNPDIELDEKGDSIDEICWPDEDSLITLDDLVFPMESILVGEGNSTETDSFSPGAPGDSAQKPAAFEVNLSDEIYSSSLRNTRQSYPQYSCKNPGQALFHRSDVWSSDSKTYYNPPINVLPHLHPMLTRFDNSVKRPVSQQKLIPGEFPIGAPYDRPIDELITQPNWLNQTKNFTLNHQQHINGGFDTQYPGRNGHWRR